MQIGDVISAIATVGFPIVACIALFWQNNRQEERHKEEMEKVTNALNNNTLAINTLAERIGNED